MRRELSLLHDQPLDLFATALTVLLCAIWGGAFVAIKISTLDMPPLGSGAVRFCLTSVVLLVWARYQRVPLCYGWAEIKTLAVLAAKGETVEELAGMAGAMRDRAVPVHSRHTRFIDTAGTGSSLAKRFNISTAAAFVVAGAGVPVAKHGSRAATSLSGSADVLEARRSAERPSYRRASCGLRRREQIRAVARTTRSSR